MKKKILLCQMLFMALFLLLLTPAMAQYDDVDQELENEELLINKDHDRQFKLHPLQLGEIYLSYEKLRTERVSNEFGLGYVYRSYFEGDDFIPDDVNVQGLHVRMSQRHYTSKKHRGTPFGFFHGPQFGYRFMVFEENVFDLPEQDPSEPDYRFVGRLYQNTVELNYQVGAQFKLGRHFTAELSAALGGRLKYALAKGAGELLTDNIIGHALTAEENSALFVVPSPQLNFAVGYSF